MRTLFLDKPAPRSRWWVWVLAAAAVVEAAALSAYMLRPAAPAIEQGYLAPAQQCAQRGQAAYGARGEWPVTADGRDAATLVASRCTLDPEAFRAPLTAGH